MSRRWWRPLGWVLLPAGAALQLWTPPRFAESAYAGHVFPHVAAILSALNGVVPFSIAELLSLLLVAAAGVGVVCALRRRAGLGRRALRCALTCLALGGYLVFAFAVVWGINYRRPPLASRMGLATGGTTADLLETARWLVGETAAQAPPGPKDEPTRLPYALPEADRRIEAAYASLAEKGLRLPGPLGPAKPVLLSGAMSRLGISGVYSPFTGEPNFDRDLPDCELPFAMAHEKAHQRGIASENEANFVAFLALAASDDPYLRYSGYLNAVEYVLGAVARSVREVYPDVSEPLIGRPSADLARVRAFWLRYRGPAQRVSRRVNDLYLRANRVEGGIRSYDAVTDLLVGYRKGEERKAESGKAESGKRRAKGGER